MNNTTSADIDENCVRIHCVEFFFSHGIQCQHIFRDAGEKNCAFSYSLLNRALIAAEMRAFGLPNVTLYEQAPEFTEVGASVNITKNANRILDAYGLKKMMTWKSSSNPPCFMEYRNYKTGECLGR